MRTSAILVAMMAFFAAAVLSFVAGCSCQTCCLRGVIAAAVFYVLASTVLRIVAAIITDALRRQQNRS